ncbi:phosphodiester glycosidase family protein [Rhizobium sp. RU36D]|uniref:phosphodiester glycosidase family protein n=1 Tax=Rhizobium sp. RU36D TaxID=1907415 RepID=UPI0009D8097E|nr:phosphodiester glycosidase family protein [Rhizobium sp. RU36D]SMD14419.1 Uncharacterized protein YigE, DUF2233 family [Rhizobium sp. RU36D]
MKFVNFRGLPRRPQNGWREIRQSHALKAVLSAAGGIVGVVFAAIAGESAVAADAGTGACRIMEEAGTRYTVCSFDPSADTIRVYDFGPDGQAYGGFSSLAAQLWKERRTLRFATNGGMYHDDLSPVGLFVEYGIERKAISTRSGYGNFHLKPNGVFYIKGKTAGVMETARYQASQITPDFATQSGPMLVMSGKLHPKFLADSDSFKRRNGVGVDAEGKVHFVISEGTVRFHDFATFFRDRLGCADALYLDGTISSLYAPEMGRNDRLFPMGPIIAVSDLIR